MAGGLFAANALLPGGWASDVALRFDDGGRITEVAPGSAQDGLPRAAGPVLPGMANVHSHAFQRLLVGRTQRTGPGDDFWSWRAAMYRMVAALDADDYRDVAAALYASMLCSGYTAVGEFHYVHRPSGAGDALPMALAVVHGAEAAGIRLTHLPVLYRRGGFDGSPLQGAQQAFGLTLDAYEALVARLRGVPGLVVGLAPHSLRAVGEDDLAAALAFAADAPVHIHVAEQPAEVADCRAASGTTPVARLLDLAPVDGRWCLVHATHTSPEERRRAAATGAVAGLCPTTEGDLGDGLFPLADWRARGGRHAVGSDSQVGVDPAGELRLLLYQQRAAALRRHVIEAGTPGLSGATALWQEAAEAGARALGQSSGVIRKGAAADLVVLDAQRPLFAGLDADGAAASFILSGGPDDLAAVLVGGRTVVSGGRHRDADALASRAAAATGRILERAG